MVLGYLLSSDVQVILRVVAGGVAVDGTRLEGADRWANLLCRRQDCCARECLSCKRIKRGAELLNRDWHSDQPA